MAALWLPLVAGFLLSEIQALEPGLPTKTSKPECEVTKWTPWGKCLQEPPCDSHYRKHHKFRSFAEHASKHSDAGRTGMRLNTATKLHTWRAAGECIKNKTCPELDSHGTGSLRHCVEGLAGVFPCRNVYQLSRISIEDLGYRRYVSTERYKMANDLWGWTDPKTGDEYAIVGTSGGTSFVRMTNATNPVVLGFLYTSPGTRASSWRDIKVVNDYAYIVSEAYGHGMQVFNLKRLRYQKTFREFRADLWYRGFGKAHNIVANQETGYVYVVGDNESKYKWPCSCKGGLHMINVKSPRRPRFEGCYDKDGYTHDAQCVVYRGPDKRYFGRELCFNYNEDSLTIVDVTNHSAPVMVSKRGYMGSRYTHQGWLTEDQSVILMDDELDEVRGRTPYEWRTRTYIWDVSDLKNPVLKNIYRSNELSIDHNQYILGNYTFQSNYAAGLRILHIDQQHYQLREIGYFDVFPSPITRPAFRGSWSNYPYFKSGNIPVSSIENGLFILRPDYAKLHAASHPTGPQGAQYRKRKIVTARNGKACPALEQRRDCTPNNICPTP